MIAWFGKFAWILTDTPLSEAKLLCDPNNWRLCDTKGRWDICLIQRYIYIASQAFLNQITYVTNFIIYTGIYDYLATWWRHQMEAFSALLVFCAGNSPVPGEFPAQRPVTRSFDVFSDLRLNKRLSTQSWGRWFQTPSRPLWRHCNDISNWSSGVVMQLIPLEVMRTRSVVFGNFSIQSASKAKKYVGVIS